MKEIGVNRVWDVKNSVQAFLYIFGGKLSGFTLHVFFVPWNGHSFPQVNESPIRNCKQCVIPDKETLVKTCTGWSPPFNFMAFFINGFTTGTWWNDSYSDASLVLKYKLLRHSLFILSVTFVLVCIMTITLVRKWRESALIMNTCSTFSWWGSHSISCVCAHHT